jgi:hypothetical protein
LTVVDIRSNSSCYYTFFGNATTMRNSCKCSIYLSGSTKRPEINKINAVTWPSNQSLPAGHNIETLLLYIDFIILLAGAVKCLQSCPVNSRENGLSAFSVDSNSVMSRTLHINTHSDCSYTHRYIFFIPRFEVRFTY